MDGRGKNPRDGFGKTSARGKLSLGRKPYFQLRSNYYLEDFEKAEDAEQVSESRFGYKFLIPVYAAFLMGSSYGFSIQTLAMILIAEIIATIVYKRKFRFEKKEWLRIGLGLLVGIVLGLIANAVR